ncbi:MAG: DNA polymerase III subunit chi [Proteobacteria bacterium]|nr:DNA polymerase III subunit chi [Pseudomonadota bacterium]
MIPVIFYHLQRSGLEAALPQLLEKALSQGMRAVVIAGSAERVAALDTALWTYGQGSFLPHGTAADGDESEQPVFLTTEAGANPNGASVVALTDGASLFDFNGFERVLDIFDGNDPDAVAAARERWRTLAAAGHGLTYWRQTEAGGWQRQASA